MNRGPLWLTLAAQRTSEALVESRRPLWCWLRMEPPQDVLTLNRWRRHWIGLATRCEIRDIRRPDPRVARCRSFLDYTGDPTACDFRSTTDTWIRVKHELWRNGYPVGHVFKYYLWCELEADSAPGSEILEQ